MGGYRGWCPWAAAALIAVIAAVWFATASFPLVDKSQVIGSAPMRPVSAGHELIQTITATRDKISRIDLILGKPMLGAEGALRLELVEVVGVGTEGALILGETLSEVNLDTGSFDFPTRHSFDFQQVNLIPGNTYAIRLTSNDSEETAVRPGGWSVDNYNGGRLYVDGEPTAADLYFSLYHNADARELLEKMKPWRPFPLNKSSFIVGLFLVGAATFGWLLRVVAAGKEG